MNPENAIFNFSKSKVLVIGDLILDIHQEGKALGVSAETPTLVVRHGHSRFSQGGAGLFVQNILALGGKATFITLLGDDEYASHQGNFTHQNLEKITFREKGRLTTVKERFWSANHKLLCWDRLDNRPVSKETEEAILAFIKQNLPSFDKLIVSDYRHGLISEKLARALVQEAKEALKPIYVDSQIAQNVGNHKWYEGATLFCLNEKEAMSVDSSFNNLDIPKSLLNLSKILNAENIILKLGEKGAVVLLGDKFISFPAYEVKALDTIGAGDAFFAVLALAPHNSLEEYLSLANIWAALSTTIIGTELPKIEMLKEALEFIPHVNL